MLAWTDHAPRDRDALIRLAYSLRFFPTDCVLSTVHATAENETAATDARVLAIDMSVGFVEPETTIGDLFTISSDRSPGLISVSHAPKLPTVADVQGERRRMIAMLRRIRERTADPLVRNAAHRYLVLLEN
ncbi:MAG TPA: hypothetical protein VF665_05730 [Longimicrobium sp.]|uniref:hypothetical protein n=1 Tax=Longimicrobium sp. TaxID=2029185 RepID=UPI002EDB5568